MNKALIFALGFVSTAALLPAHAQTYQWKDSAGKTVISDTPPSGSVRDSRAIGGRLPVAASSEKPAEKAGEAPLSTAEKDLEFKRRQQEAREKAERQSKEETAARDRKENCERARSNLIALQGAQPIATYDEKGERRLLEGEQRQQEIERTRRFVDDACK